MSKKKAIKSTDTGDDTILDSAPKLAAGVPPTPEEKIIDEVLGNITDEVLKTIATALAIKEAASMTPIKTSHTDCFNYASAIRVATRDLVKLNRGLTAIFSGVNNAYYTSGVEGKGKVKVNIEAAVGN